MKNRLLSLSLFLLVFAALTALSVLPVSAEEQELIFDEPPRFLTVYGDDGIPGLDSEDLENLKGDIRAAVKYREEWIDISGYHIPYTDHNWSVLYDLPIDDPADYPIKSMQLYLRGSECYSIALEYYTDDECAEIEYAVGVLLDGIEGSGLSDAEKVLAVHDRLAVWCEYDYVNYRNNTIPDDSYRIYGPLVNRISVCDGYARAFSLLMNTVGIPTRYIDSKLLNHAWNVVTIDGKDYHVDVTHDDPVPPDRMGYARHSHFLISTETLMACGSCHNRNDFDPEYRICNTEFEEAGWNLPETNCVLFDGALWRMGGFWDTLSLYRLEDGEWTAVKCFGDILTDTIWWAVEDGPGYIYTSCYSCIQTDGEKLYFNLTDNVYSYDPDTDAVDVFFAPEEAQTTECNIYGFRLDNGVPVVQLGSAPNGTMTLVTGTPRVPGDVNGDGKVNIRDVIELLSVSLSEQPSASFDYNGDGSVDILDASLLLQYSLFPDIYPLG